MHRLDPITVQKILDTADIVDVVSDFVSLKPRGTGYIGLCPFHNDRRPSFSVSKTRNVCKCFSCGQGGGPVNFIMLHEQMTYQEALRYLAKKYNIEIKEREMTDEERAQEGERQSMLAINDYALGRFHSTMLETDEGRNVGLAYFRERGISDAMIERFKLGYSLENRDAFCREAIAKGFSREYLVKTGLTYDTEHGLRDRFRGRVIYPVFTMSGKVVAFGGRTLRKDKDIAKYVNSPESLVYSKKRELYGLYQAKRAIAARDKCIMVEGYMDVISMHQRGVENVVASSGTALTEEQIRLVHRFTDNVMLVYDSDAAGIKASLRGIGMLLSEGMNITVLHLPDGEDPDSFAQSHSSTEVEEYIRENETDFIRFMTRILLSDAKDDPIRRAKVINRIVGTIALIPDEITRTVYIGECSRMLEIDEKVLTLQVARDRADKSHRDAEAQARRRNAAMLPAETTPAPADQQQGADTTPPQQTQQQTTPQQTTRAPEDEAAREERKFLLPAEMELMKYVLRYGAADLASSEDDRPVSVLEYIDLMLREDEIRITNKALARTYAKALELLHGSWEADRAARVAQQSETDARARREGIEQIRATATDLAAIEREEAMLDERIAAESGASLDEFACNYLERRMVNDPDDMVRTVVTELISERHQLSKIHTKFSHVATEREKLTDLVPRAIAVLKYATVELRLYRLGNELRRAQSAADDQRMIEVIRQMQEQNSLKMALAKYLGERTVVGKF